MIFSPPKQHKPKPVCGKDEDECRQERAIARCDDQIDWYERQKRTKRWLYWFFQNAVIVLTALTPILILWANVPEVESRGWPLLDEHKPSALLTALPAALAAMLAAIMSSYQWREQWTRFGFTAEMLKSEKVKFETRTTADYSGNEEDALSNFVTRIEALISAEVGDWRALFKGEGFKPTKDADGEA
jgi:hypothetical protein